MVIKNGLQVNLWYFVLLLLHIRTAKITSNGDFSHEIKRRLLLGKKIMTNLDSISKSRDITLPTKVHLVKAMVFPVVMCGCESWTLKKAELKELMLFNSGEVQDAFELAREDS